MFQMNLKILIFVIFSIFVLYVSSEEIKQQTLPLIENEENSVHTRSKRTLFLKKKVLGAGLLGFGLGVVKG